MKRNFKEIIEELGLNFKLEIIKIILINIVLISSGVVLLCLLKQTLFGVFLLFLDIVFTFFYLTRYGDMQRKNIEKHNSEFISLLSYFEIFINNNKNVYNSFQLLIPYSSLWMKEKIEILLKQIDEDKTVKPFVTFASNFSNKVIHSVMISIFQMVDAGENNDSMQQFDFLFIQMSTNQQIEMTKRKESQLDSLNSLPLIGAGAISIILIISILMVVGGMINGL